MEVQMYVWNCMETRYTGEWHLRQESGGKDHGELSLLTSYFSKMQEDEGNLANCMCRTWGVRMDVVTGAFVQFKQILECFRIQKKNNGYESIETAAPATPVLGM